MATRTEKRIEEIQKLIVHLHKVRTNVRVSTVNKAVHELEFLLRRYAMFEPAYTTLLDRLRLKRLDSTNGTEEGKERLMQLAADLIEGFLRGDPLPGYDRLRMPELPVILNYTS